MIGSRPWCIHLRITILAEKRGEVRPPEMRRDRRTRASHTWQRVKSAKGESQREIERERERERERETKRGGERMHLPLARAHHIDLRHSIMFPLHRWPMQARRWTSARCNGGNSCRVNGALTVSLALRVSHAWRSEKKGPIGCPDGQMDRRTDGRTNKWTNVRTYVYVRYVH